MDVRTMFVVKEETVGAEKLVVVRSEVSGEFFSIIPSAGGRLRELFLRKNGRIISVLKRVELINSADRDHIFSNAKLSPFAGRIKAGTYSLRDKVYSLPLNYPEERNACHGFVFDKKFEFTKSETSDQHASVSFRYQYAGDCPGYPFPYDIELHYILAEGDGLVCATKIINRSDAEIPLSDGWHYYFDIGEKVDDVKIAMNSDEIIEVDSQRIPTGSRKDAHDFASAAPIGSRHFDSCFAVSTSGGRAVTRMISEKQNLTLNIWQDTGDHQYNYLVLYTPPDRRSLAIEPMTSNVNSFNNGEGLLLLPPGCDHTLRCGISIGS